MVKFLLMLYFCQSVIMTPLVFASESDEPLAQMREAIFSGQKQKLKRMLDEIVNINAADPDGELMGTAVFFGRNWAVVELIKANYNFDREDGFGRTPLMQAVSRRGNLPLVKILVEAGADVHHINDSDGSDILSSAITSGDMKIVDYIMSKMAGNLPERCVISHGALGAAVGRDNLAMMRRLLKDSTEALRYLDSFHQTALMQAVKRGNWQTYSFLLSKGAELDTVDRHQNNLLHAAISSPRRNKKIIADLLKKGVNPNARNMFSQSPLDLAVETDDPEIIKMLIEAGADPNQISGSIPETRRRLLARAFLSGKFKAAQELAKHVSVDALNDGLKGAIASELPRNKFFGFLEKLPPDPVRDGKLLALGGQKGDLKILEKLLARGAKLNELEGDQSAVMRATSAGQLAALRWLDQKGADLNLINGKKATALHLAASSRQGETLQYLLDKNVLFDRRDEKGETALFAAARSNFGPGIEKLLARGANAGISNHENYNPLMMAVQNGQVEAARALVSQSPLTAADNFGRSALHVAVYLNKPELVRILIAECAPTDQKDRHGDSAYDYLFYAQNKAEIRAILDSRAQVTKCQR
ncbi:MAG: hypothetical protein A2X86_00370 [Bdellovibrionales bacterium GWA2_49_15]|nr:MAG: hypothetical protein A2X86_00370 [Bdellovibrionales bacterium GWA2_49_15]HAZ14497.1 hypothetical protein [Bdellovibrionales bacterium]